MQNSSWRATIRNKLMPGLIWVVLIFSLVQNAHAAEELLFPASNETVQFSYNGNSTSNWDAVNKSGEADYSDDFYKCVNTNNSSSFSTDIYNFDEFTLTGVTINSVTIHGHFFTYQSSNGLAKLFIRLGSSNYENTQTTTTGTAAWITYTMTQNPATSAAWSLSDVQAIQAGAMMRAASGGYNYCDSVYITIDYTEEEEEGGGTTPPQGTIYTVPVFVNDWTGEYTTDFETYRSQSQIRIFGEDGPSIFMTKKDLIQDAALFGIVLAGIITWALFKAVL